MQTMNENKMQLILRNDDREFISNIPWDSDLESVFDAFIGMLVSETFSYKGILTTMYDKARELLSIYHPDVLKDEEDDYSTLGAFTNDEPKCDNTID